MISYHSEGETMNRVYSHSLDVAACSIREMDVRRGLEQLAKREPTLLTQRGVKKVLSGEATLLESWDVIEDLLKSPDICSKVCTCFRPSLLRMVTRILQRQLDATGPWCERIVLMCSIVISLAPQTEEVFVNYFQQAPSPLARFTPACSDIRLEETAQDLDLVRAFHMTIIHSRALCQLWGISPLSTVLKKDSPITWHALQVIFYKFNMIASVRKSVEAWFLPQSLVLECQLSWREALYSLQLERSCMFIESEREAIVSEFLLPETTCPSPASLANICGIELLSHNVAIVNTKENFVLTDTNKNILQVCAFALAEGTPLLMEGPPGSGKSSLIQFLASSTGNDNLVTLHLDDKLDSKSLLGSYVCGRAIGEFCWQDGPLTQAVTKGMWLVLEDIDFASFELISALQSLLQDRKLYIPGKGSVIKAAHGFQLFATMSNGPGVTSRNPSVREYLLSKFFTIEVKHLPVEEIVIILTSLFPNLVEAIPRMMCALFQLNQAVAGRPSELIPQDMPAWNWLKANKHKSTMFSPGMASGFKGVSLRELIRWCERVVAYHKQALALMRPNLAIPSCVREKIVHEGADVLIGTITRKSIYEASLKSLADSFAIPQEFVLQCVESGRPSLEIGQANLKLGRSILTINSVDDCLSCDGRYVHTGHALRLMERVSVAVQLNEPVLLVGETGTGKTALVQHLASLTRQKLIVINMSQQTDSSDFLGGFRPMCIEDVIAPLLQDFEELFPETFPADKNSLFLERVHGYARKKRWASLVKAFTSAAGKAVSELSKSTETISTRPLPKRQKRNPSEVIQAWKEFYVASKNLESKVSQYTSGAAFAFVEGVLVQALTQGSWILLDEINLAPADTLERLAGVLEGPGGSLVLTERGDIQRIKRSPTFRLFACMNPGTDVGKKSLPPQLRSRFTEIAAPEPFLFEDLHALVAGLLSGTMPDPPVTPVVSFYMKCKEEAGVTLLDSGDSKPQYSLRTLYRALEYTRAAMPIYGFGRALYDGFSMTFMTLLKRDSVRVMEALLENILMSGKKVPSTSHAPTCPGDAFVLFDSFWVKKGAEPINSSRLNRFIRTTSVSAHLKNLARAVLIGKYPILLQGPTSSGKTSLVGHLAEATGHRLLRVNNHEHTDLSEYLGSYTSTPFGGLSFKDGVLVQAMRQGHWVVLDELNLAPTEVLEALNRLLDDNRELFVPDTQETIRPHPHFMLFATQNPPGFYGGRKPLSRAFRSRFLEIHVDDIPDQELASILEQRCLIPKSYADKMVDVQKDLQRHRRASLVFAGKQGLVTPRILFRWAERQSTGYQELAEDGYTLLAERLRVLSERDYVRSVLERILRVQINVQNMYNLGTSSIIKKLEDKGSRPNTSSKIVWTASMQRLLYLVHSCMKNGEHVLLVGETGCGKTTVCELLASAMGKKLYTVNCHQHTEASDFIGGYRPFRVRDQARQRLEKVIHIMGLDSHLAGYVPQLDLETDLENAILCLGKAIEEATLVDSEDTCKALNQEIKVASDMLNNQRIPFEWEDGPLVHAMQSGDFLLIDELSLADDAVLERLNSVLEPDRTLMITEKGGGASEIVGHGDFVIFATMNPGGDFGKRELSPALRNRFTEIWVPRLVAKEELTSIVHEQLQLRDPLRTELTESIMKFWTCFCSDPRNSAVAANVSVRDLLSWTSFINATIVTVDHWTAFVHGAHLTFIDGLGLIHFAATENQRSNTLDLLENVIPVEYKDAFSEACASKETSPLITMNPEVGLMVGPFTLPTGSAVRSQPEQYSLQAPTVARNALKVARALQVTKPILLEGSPGVGKTSLIETLARLSGNRLIRINLSEQTDLMDLLGADLPAEGNQEGEFIWSDGPLLHALKNGNWVLLDELNLASQSVLEGLNALLDYRSELYIPELSKTFRPSPGFRVFGAQNPVTEGGGRKGLPRSFLNRFTKLWCEALQENDYCIICKAIYPDISTAIIEKMVRFNAALHDSVSVRRNFGGSGSPWEFNLRDVMRWCELICKLSTQQGKETKTLESNDVYPVMSSLYMQQMRTANDRKQVHLLFMQHFACEMEMKRDLCFFISQQQLDLGLARLPIQMDPSRTVVAAPEGSSVLLPRDIEAYETAAHCIASNWLCIVVGPQGAGKTTFVRNLSLLSNNRLHECNLTSGTDATDILGGFEQRNMDRKVLDAQHQVEQSLRSIVDGLFSSMREENASEIVSEVLYISALWEEFHSQNDGVAQENNTNKLGSLIRILQVLHCTCLKFHCQVERLHILLSQLQELRSKYSMSSDAQSSGLFEWVDGILTKAMEDGHWVLLEGANLCNPAVLDRLNPVLETGGKLLINEAGLVNGRLRVIDPHPNFRLFFALDPKHGELSRAMRNRGVEVYIAGNMQLEDSSREHIMLSKWSLPGNALRNTLVDVHGQVGALMGRILATRFSLSDLDRLTRLFVYLMNRGAKSQYALLTAYKHTYLHRLPQSLINAEVINQAFGAIEEGVLPKDEPYLINSYGWPMETTIQNLVQNPWWSRVGQDLNCLQEICASSWLVQELVPLQPERTFCFEYPNNLKSTVIAGLSVQWIKALLGLAVQSSSDLTPVACNIERGVSERVKYAALIFIERGVAEDMAMRHISINNLLQSVQSLSVGLCTFFKRVNHTFRIGIPQDCTLLLQLKRFCLQVAWQRVLIEELGQNNIGVRTDASSSWLQQSYWFQMAQGKDFFMCRVHPCIDWLYPFIVVQQEFLESILCSDIRTCEGLLESVILWHCDFFCCCHSSLPDVGEITLCFIKCMKSTKKLIHDSNWSDQGLLEKITYVEKGMQKALGILRENAKSILWKKSGKPTIPMTSELLDHQEQFFWICDQLHLTTSFSEELIGDTRVELQNRHILSLHAGYALRKKACEGASLVTMQVINPDQSIYNHKMLVHLGDSLRGEAAKIPWRIAALSFGEADNASDDRDKPYKSTFSSQPQTVFWWSHFQLLINKMEEMKSFALEMNVIQRILHCLMCNKVLNHADWNKCTHGLEYFMESGLSAAPRSPYDFMPAQMVLWGLKELDDASWDRSKLQSYFTEQLQRMIWTFYRARWHGIQGLEIEQNQEGPPYLVQKNHTSVNDVLNSCSFPVFMDLFGQDTTAGNVVCRKLQLLHVSRNCTEGWLEQFKQDRNTLEVTTILHFCGQIVLAFEDTFDSEKWDEIGMLLQFLLEYSSAAGGVDLPQLDSIISNLECTLQTSRDSRFKELSLRLLLPVLSTLLAHPAALVPSRCIGYAWTLVGLLRLHLVRPLSAVDPSYKATLLFNILKRKTQGLEGEMEVRTKFQSLPLQIQVDTCMPKLQAFVEQLKMQSKQQERRCVARPTHLHYQDLKQDINRFAEGIASVDRICSLANNLLKDTGTDAHSLQNISLVTSFQDISTKFLDASLAQYFSYNDILQPVQLALYEMKNGLDLMAISLRKKMVSTKKKKLISAISSLMCFPQALSYNLEYALILSSPAIQELDTCIYRNNLDIDRSTSSLSTAGKQITAYVSAMRLYKTSRRSRLAHNHEDLKVVQRALQGIYDLWREWQEHVLAMEQEATELFKYKHLPPCSRTDEENEEVEFREMFPDHSMLFQDLNKTEDINAVSVETPSSPMKDHHQKRKPDVDSLRSFFEGDFLSTLINVHGSIFLPVDQEIPTSCCVQDKYFAANHGAARQLLECIEVENLEEEGFSLAGHLKMICGEMKMYQAPAKEQETWQTSDNPVDFHHDSNPAEASLIRDPLLCLQAKLQKLLADWPENAVLQELDLFCARLLGLHLKFPLKSFSTGLELLLSKIQVWEESAAKHVSLQEEAMKLAALARRWRKIELLSWKYALEHTATRHAALAHNSWFDLLGLVNCSEVADLDTHELVQGLYSYIRSSTLGQFKTKMLHLFTFRCQLQCSLGIELPSDPDSTRKRKMYAILNNVWEYYKQFELDVEGHIQEQRKVLEKEALDFVNLMKWEDRGYYALKESTYKSARMIHKTCRKLQDILSKPFTCIIAMKRDSMGIADVVSDSPLDPPVSIVSRNSSDSSGHRDYWEAGITQMLDFFPGGNTVTCNLQSVNSSKYVQKVRSLTKALTTHFKDVFELQISRTGLVSSLEFLSSDLATQIQALQQDKKATKQLKKKVLTDFLHAFRDLGLPRRQMSRKCKHPLDWAELQPLPENLSTKIFNSSDWIKGEEYFFKSLVRVEQVFELEHIASTDLSPEEIANGISFTDQLGYLQRYMRKSICKHAHYLELLRRSVNSISNLYEQYTLYSKDTLWRNIGQLPKDPLPEIIALASSAVDYRDLLMDLMIHESMKGRKQEFESMELALGKVRCLLENMIKEWHYLREKCLLDECARAAYVRGPLYKHMSSDANSLREDLIALNCACKNGAQKNVHLPGLATFIHRLSALEKELSSFFQQSNDKMMVPQTDRFAHTDAEELVHILDDCLKHSLMWSQKIIKSYQTLQDQGKHERSLSVEVQCQDKLLGASDMATICRHLHSAVLLVHRGLQSYADRSSLLQVLVECLPFYQNLLISYETILTNNILLYKATAKLGYIGSASFIELLKHGFCATEEGHNETSDTGNATEIAGVGIGDGKGKKDVSDEIENEDQVLGNDQHKEEEIEEEEQRDTDARGIEMGSDFGGQPEDISEGEQEEGKSEDEEESFEQEMGEFESGEDVDERMWDEEDKTNESMQNENGKGNVENGQGEVETRGMEQDSEDKQIDKSTDEPPMEDTHDCTADERSLSEEKARDQDDTHSGYDVETEEDFELPQDMNLDGGVDTDNAELSDEDGEENCEIDSLVDEKLPKSPEMVPNDGASDENHQEKEGDSSIEEPQEEEEKALEGKEEKIDEQRDDEFKGKRSERARQDCLAHSQTDNEGPSSAAPPQFAQPSAEEDPTNAVERSGADPAEEAQRDMDNQGDGIEPNNLPAAAQTNYDSGGNTGHGQKNEAASLPGKSDTHTSKEEEEQVNSSRTLADAIREWKRILASEVTDADKHSGAQLDPPESEALGPEFEFLQKDDIDNDETQFAALASATEEQHVEMQQSVLDRAADIAKDNVHYNEADDMDLSTVAIEDGNEVIDVDGVDAQPQVMARAALRPEVHSNTKLSFVSSIVEAKAKLEEMDIVPTPQSIVEGEQCPSTQPVDDQYQLAECNNSQRWMEYEQISHHISGDLVEQLRLLLEPTSASKLGGEFKSGKRINMRKVIAYIASSYKKDKIWMRRTKPDKRKYQVVLAIDDSISMIQNNCSHFALESVALIATALSQLEVGELGIISWGGNGGVQLKHPLEEPFTQNSGIRMFSEGFKFDQDNTIADKPAGQLLSFLDRMLLEARERVDYGYNVELQQLVLIIADGHFHEKESLKFKVRQMMENKGLLLAFIVLDSPTNSLMDMQSVSFEEGKPLFQKYMDSFPFPYYIVLRETSLLPQTLADLLKQWFECCVG